MTRTVLFLLGISALSSAFPAGANDSVEFTGTLEGVACAQACGNCCGSDVVSEENAGFTALVNGSSLDLTPYRDGQTHRFSGYFFKGAGLCGEGACTYFHVSAVDRDPDQPTLDLSTVRLHVPGVLVDGQEHWSLELTVPCTVLAAERIDGIVVEQGGDCSHQGAVCAEGLTCVSYFGIAGAAGPLFRTCEIPCAQDSDCPGVQTCVVVADGPGQVCQ